LAAVAIPLTRSPRGSEVFYALAALVSAACAACAIYVAVGTLPQTLSLPIGLPGIGTRLRLDALSAVFAVIVNGADQSLINSLAARGDVDYLMANHRIPVEDQPSDSLANALQEVTAVEWNIQRVNADDVWAMGYTGQGTVVANVDTGVQWDHPALQDQYRGWDGAVADHNYNWYDPYHQGPGGGTIPQDVHGHGTHTMGTMVGDDGAANQIGMAPGAQWIARWPVSIRHLLSGEPSLRRWIVALGSAGRTLTNMSAWLTTRGGSGGDHWVHGAVSLARRHLPTFWRQQWSRFITRLTAATGTAAGPKSPARCWLPAAARATTGILRPDTARCLRPFKRRPTLTRSRRHQHGVPHRRCARAALVSRPAIGRDLRPDPTERHHLRTGLQRRPARQLAQQHLR
jgi:hypothetical protein